MARTISRPIQFNAIIVTMDGRAIPRKGATWQEVAQLAARTLNIAGVVDSSPVFIARDDNNDIRNVSQYTVGELRREFNR